ncbi:MAG: PEP-CTERM system histidine kinase PrsK [Burkholderiales bacterium]|nr:PEP-CTERM system histidine kinase PrsK [Burkholderiales bacterium]
MVVSVGTLSYASAALAYGVLSVLLITSWRGRLPGALLGLASVMTAAWALAMAYQGARPDASKLPGELLEIGHKTAWFAFLFILLGYARQAARPIDGALRRVALTTLGACVTIMILVIALRAGDSPFLREWRFSTSIVAPGLLALLGMLLVEHLYRNTNPQQRWSVKFLCLGLGAYFAFDFYLFSEAMLFRRVNADIWSARGVVVAMIAPLIAVSAARNPTWSLDVFVSRQVVFHSTTLLGAAAYLLVMATAGYYIRYFGGSWGGLLQVMFLFGAGVLLVLMLFSGTLRARVKVFLSKHFFSYRYDYREEWLRFTRTLSEGATEGRIQERCIEALAQLVESPSGALWLRQESGAYEQVARWNHSAAGETEAADSALVSHLRTRQWVINLDEFRGASEVYEGLQLPEWLANTADAWLVVPLALHDSVHGFVVLTRSRGRVTFNWEISDLLKTAGSQAASYVVQAQAAEALARAKQFESFNKLSAFVVHDLKNLVAQLSLLLRNAQRHKHNPAFQQDMLETIESSVAKMNRILMQLRSGGLPVEQPAAVVLDDIVERAVASKQMYRPKPSAEILDRSLCVAASSERLERVVGHLVQNAVEATPPDGTVTVRVQRQGANALIEVADTGKGMTEDFIRNGLFKPFESTKSNGMGIGTYESREYIRELGGKMEVRSEPGAGSTFVIALPVSERVRSINETTLRKGVG